ncbi:GFA family protein [Cognatiyoonia sp.]|uniref:GFA family protein n=1 Tax=Cognatiyoonia sp. TaxID=2211652 RepID=UPI003F6A275A
MTTLKGQCECGAVALEVKNPRQEVTFCHCGQCRRTSGHFWAATNAQLTDLTFTRDSGLKWFASSDFAKRGFCKDCGSSLFYRMNGEEGIGIAISALNQPTGFKPSKHIFVADKGDYYDIADGVPQLDKF